MNTLVNIVCWLNMLVWLAISIYYYKRLHRLQSDGLRMLERMFLGVVSILLISVTYHAVYFAFATGLFPDSWGLSFGQLPMQLILGIVILGGGLFFLLQRTRYVDRWDKELALNTLYTRYRYMMEADPRAILLFSRTGTMLEINRMGREWVIGPDSQLDGCTLMHVMERLLPDDPQGLRERIMSKEPVEVRVGERILSEFEWTELCDDKGRLIGSVLCVKDVTEERQFQKEIIQSEKLAVVGQLAAATAHEIRNPLTSIKGFLQLMDHRLKDGEDGELREYTRIMVEEVDRMEKIIRDFLLMTKPSDVIHEPTDLNAVLERMLILVQNQATLRNIQVETQLEELPEVMMHKEAIQQVILNLLQNAFEAMNIGGTLTLKTFQDPKYVAVEVIDTGVGMTDEEIANLGSPFYSTKTEGTGLGLTVSSKIIREHGGRLNVVSTKGTGTTITIRLPKQAERA